VKEFHDLTVIGRARRLRAVVGAALDHYDLDVARIRLITNETNGIFRVDTTDGAKHVMRVGLGGAIAHPAGTVAAETEWLQALADETDLTVPVPLRTKEGESFVTVGARDVPDQRNVVVFSWLPGRLLDDRLSAESMRGYGALAATLHLHGLRHRPSGPGVLARYDRIDPFDEPFVLFEEDGAAMPPGRLAVFTAAAERVDTAIRRLQTGGEPMRMLHGDLHIWNVMVSRSGLAPFDFEDLMWGWPVQDVATSLYYLWVRPEFGSMLELFRAGYETVAEWPERHAGDVETFIAGRMIVLANDLLITPEWRSLAAGYLERYEERLRQLLR